MWWIKIENEKELKKIAKEKYKTRYFENVKKEINEDIENFLDEINLNVGPKNTKKIVASGWRELSEKIIKINNIKERLQGEKEEIDYFKSRSDEIIFYILELSGRKRNEKLGVKESYYVNKKEAKSWRNNILKEIHPDKCHNPKASDAINEFKQLCRLIVG